MFLCKTSYNELHDSTTMFFQPEERVTLFGGDSFHMKLLEFIVEFSEEKSKGHYQIK